jgi:hypothetical protein
MTDFDLATLAREAREQVQPGAPPLDAITAPPGRRPRGRWVVMAAAAAVVLVIGTVVALPHRSSGPEPSPAVPSIPGLVPPDGMRWVGAGHVVLAAPTTWADSQYGCETDPRPSVVYDLPYWQTCQDTSLGRERKPAALWVVADRRYADYVSTYDRRARIPVPSVSGRRSEPWRVGGDAGRYWYEVLVVPSTSTALVAQATSRAAVVAMIGSARRTPDKVAVPPATAGDDLATARAALSGYDVRVVTVSGFYRAESVIGSDPAFGTPLAPGATITLTVSSGLGDRPSMSDAFLERHGVKVEPLGTISPADQRVIDQNRAAIEESQAGHPSPWASQLVLRRITTTINTSNGVPVLQHRLAWLRLVPHQLTASLGGPCCDHRSPPAGVGRDISVYDALTGAFVWGTSF